MNEKRISRKIARKQFWEEHDRDEYECPDCGRKGSEIYSDHFEVHHQDGNPFNNSVENLVALCRLCHNLREGKKPSVNSVRKLREMKGGESADISNTEMGTSTALQHSLDAIRTLHPKDGMREKEGAEKGIWTVNDGLGFDPSEIMEMTATTRREAAIFRAGMWAMFERAHSQFKRMQEFTDLGRCQKCGEKTEHVHSFYNGPEDADDWYMVRISDFAYYCMECHPEIDMRQKRRVRQQQGDKRIWPPSES